MPKRSRRSAPARLERPSHEGLGHRLHPQQTADGSGERYAFACADKYLLLYDMCFVRANVANTQDESHAVHTDPTDSMGASVVDSSDLRSDLHSNADLTSNIRTSNICTSNIPATNSPTNTTIDNTDIINEYNLSNYDNDPIPYAFDLLHHTVSNSRKKKGKSSARKRLKSISQSPNSSIDTTTEPFGDNEEDLQVLMDYIQNVDDLDDLPNDLLSIFSKEEIGGARHHQFNCSPNMNIFEPYNSSTDDDSNSDSDSSDHSNSTTNDNYLSPRLLNINRNLSNLELSFSQSDNDSISSLGSAADDDTDNQPSTIHIKSSTYYFKKSLDVDDSSSSSSTDNNPKNFKSRLRHVNSFKRKHYSITSLSTIEMHDSHFDSQFSEKFKYSENIKGSKREWKSKKKLSKLLQKKENRNRSTKLSAQVFKDDHDGHRKHKTSVSVNFVEVNNIIQEFVSINERESLAFPSMPKKSRRYVQRLAVYYNLKFKTVGSGIYKPSLIIRNKHTRLPDEEQLIKIKSIIKEAQLICNMDSWGGRVRSQSIKGKSKKSQSVSVLATRYILSHGTIVGDGAAPIHVDNVGHRMLRLMGWNQGQPLGLSMQGLLTPVEAIVRGKRRGLGT